MRVFEADWDKRRWSEVKDLGNQVLFVGTTGSRAFTLAGSRGGNRVFLLGNDRHYEVMLASAALCKCSDCKRLSNCIPAYCVYDMVSRKASLVSLGSVKHSRSEWFFPSMWKPKVPTKRWTDRNTHVYISHLYVLINMISRCNVNFLVVRLVLHFARILLKENNFHMALAMKLGALLRQGQMSVDGPLDSL